MVHHKHDSESMGSKRRDHIHLSVHQLKQAHKNWRVWFAVFLMVALILVYVMTDNESIVPGSPNGEQMPAMAP